jgi:hypothetical protein
VADTVQDLCMALALAFREGRLERLSDHYIYPLAIYSPRGLWIEGTPQQTAEIIFRRRAVALALGMADVRVTIGEIAEVDGGRLRAGVAWDFLDARGRSLGRSELSYFCRRGADAQLRVEMIEFSRLAFEDATRPEPPPPRRS